MVNTATFLVSVGGTGLVVTDDANPNTGLANGGHRERLVPAFSNVVSIADFVVARALEAQAYAASAAGGATTNATSSTTASVPALGGTLTLNNIASTSTYNAGMKVAAVSTATPTTKGVYGTVVSWTPGAGPSTGTLVIEATDEVVGSGSVSGWSISISQFGVPKARTVTGGGLATGGGDLSTNRVITVPAAVAADVLTRSEATKAWTSDAYWDAQDGVNVAYGSTITLNLAQGCNFFSTWTGAPTLANPINGKVGQEFSWEITVGAGGGQPAFGTAWERENGAKPFSTTVGQKNTLVGKVMPSGKILWDVKRNPRA